MEAAEVMEATEATEVMEAVEVTKVMGTRQSRKLVIMEAMEVT